MQETCPIFRKTFFFYTHVLDFHGPFKFYATHWNYKILLVSLLLSDHWALIIEHWSSSPWARPLGRRPGAWVPPPQPALRSSPSSAAPPQSSPPSGPTLTEKTTVKSITSSVPESESGINQCCGFIFIESGSGFWFKFAMINWRKKVFLVKI